MENTHRQAFLVNTLTYPLQLQIGFHEIHANMWVRNGMQMKGQAMTYVQNHFCSSFSDADLFLMQIVASKLDSSLFMLQTWEQESIWQQIYLLLQRSILETKYFLKQDFDYYNKSFTLDSRIKYILFEIQKLFKWYHSEESIEMM